jgi:predicted alpha/beta-fold hydrolase
MQGFLHKAFREGWNAVLLNLYDLNLSGNRPVIFHSGSSRELEGIVNRVLDLDPCGTLVLVAVSMGGNILLKLLGEWGEGVPDQVRAAAVISPLVDLVASWDTLDRFTNRHYRWHYVHGLRQVVRRNERDLAKHIDVEGIRNIKSIREFDEIFTSVLGGFRDAFDYYRRASALPWLGKIRVPTLVLHSKRDPILPWGPLMTAGLRENPNVLLWLSREGGHVGFIEHEGPDIDRNWAENRIIDYARMWFGVSEATGRPQGSRRPQTRNSIAPPQQEPAR